MLGLTIIFCVVQTTFVCLHPLTLIHTPDWPAFNVPECVSSKSSCTEWILWRCSNQLLDPSPHHATVPSTPERPRCVHSGDWHWIHFSRPTIKRACVSVSLSHSLSLSSAKTSISLYAASAALLTVCAQWPRPCNQIYIQGSLWNPLKHSG